MPVNTIKDFANQWISDCLPHFGVKEAELGNWYGPQRVRDT